MTFNPISTLFLISSLTLMMSCQEINSISGSGNIATRTQDLNSFTEVELTNFMDVEIFTGSTNQVEFSDYDNLLQYYTFDVVGNRLVIKTNPGNTTIRHSEAKARVYVAGPLSALQLLGSGNLTLMDSFDGISECTISGSGNIVAEASATSSNMDASISGSGNIDILKISIEQADCTISGSGNISITVSKSLKADITGSGNIFYYGNPTVSKTVPGSGNVIKLQ